MKRTVKRIVEDNDTRWGRVFDLVIQALVVVSLVSFSMETLGVEDVCGCFVRLSWSDTARRCIFDRLAVGRRRMGESWRTGWL